MPAPSTGGLLHRKCGPSGRTVRPGCAYGTPPCELRPCKMSRLAEEHAGGAELQREDATKRVFGDDEGR